MALDYNSQRFLKTFLRDVTQKNKLNETVEKYLGDIKPIDSFIKVNEIPFSSDKKYGACVYKDFTLVLGAPEILLEKSSKEMKTINAYTNESFRVVVFGRVDGQIGKNDEINKKFKLLATIVLDDPIREETPSTLQNLLRENIDYKIISGDSQDTVLAIAKRVNMNYPTNAISGDELDKLNGEDLDKAIMSHNIFARVKPQQKQKIVRTFKNHSLFTIMIGDGANDVLALRESNLGIAMNGGSVMAKDVADVVLLNNSFSTLPVLLYEARRIITNIQTIANIYLIKNISSIVTILFLGFVGLRFPFDPRHVEISGFLVIGLPSFLLAFEKHNFYTTREDFMRRLLFFSGVVGFINSLVYTTLYTYYDLYSEKLFYSRTVLLTSIIFLGVNNLILIYLQHYSLDEIFKRKIVVSLLLLILILFFISLGVPQIRSFFLIDIIAPIDLLISFCASLIGSLITIIFLKRMHLV